ncbi:MAG TPA: hypothetical protein VN087_11445 [Verrucomicrobiae bacterium]|jgi:hypothetical protein|nr:hypothetical protein [Verrucomicrobiae bacterium]
MNSQQPKGDVSHSLGVACRPTLVFVVAFALNVTPHEIVHAITSYLLGFNSTVFQMWVNPDAAEAARWQTVLIAGSGPFFSLTVGAVSWLIYKRSFTERPAGLGFLMMSIVGIYSFLGPLAGTAFGGDFHVVFTFLNVAVAFGYLTSAIGFLLLPIFMYYSGGELFRWVPSEFGRAKAIVCATVAPWVVGTAILLLVYWPLPRFLIGSTVVGSVFWAFAVLGAALRFSSRRPAEILASFTRTDLILMIAVLTMVRLLATGVRLVH